jgi:hypothetical protein
VFLNDIDSCQDVDADVASVWHAAPIPAASSLITIVLVASATVTGNVRAGATSVVHTGSAAYLERSPSPPPTREVAVSFT